MVAEDHTFAFWPQGGGETFPFFLGENYAPEIGIYGLRLPIEIRDVLINHLQRPGKRAPSLSKGRMRVTRRVNIGSGLVHSGVNKESGGVGGTSRVPADNIAGIVYQDHVCGFEEAEVAGEGVCPEGVWVFGVADGDVAAHSFGVAFAGEDSEGAGLDVCEVWLGMVFFPGWVDHGRDFGFWLEGGLTMCSKIQWRWSSKSVKEGIGGRGVPCMIISNGVLDLDCLTTISVESGTGTAEGAIVMIGN